MSNPSVALSIGSKFALALRIWIAYLLVHMGLRRRDLPGLVRHLAQHQRQRREPPEYDPAWLGHIVAKVLRIGRFEPRCIFKALVLFCLLRRAGQSAELVIGLPQRPEDHDAHAWIELDGRDVGPPPGRGTHEALARFG